MSRTLYLCKEMAVFNRPLLLFPSTELGRTHNLHGTAKRLLWFVNKLLNLVAPAPQAEHHSTSWSLLSWALIVGMALGSFLPEPHSRHGFKAAGRLWPKADNSSWLFELSGLFWCFYGFYTASFSTWKLHWLEGNCPKLSYCWGCECPVRSGM